MCVTAAIGYGALINVWGRREKGRGLGYVSCSRAAQTQSQNRDRVGEMLKRKQSSPSQKKAQLFSSADHSQLTADGSPLPVATIWPWGSQEVPPLPYPQTPH